MGGSNEVYLYEEKHSHTQVIGKFFARNDHSSYHKLRAVGLVNYFDPIIISGDYGYRKSDTRLFQHALAALKIRPEQAIFVGNDLYHDIAGAQWVGMKAILVSYDQNNMQSQATIPDYTISYFAALPQATNHLITPSGYKYIPPF